MGWWCWQLRLWDICMFLSRDRSHSGPHPHSHSVWPNHPIAPVRLSRPHLAHSGVLDPNVGRPHRWAPECAAGMRPATPTSFIIKNAAGPYYVTEHHTRQRNRCLQESTFWAPHETRWIRTHPITMEGDTCFLHRSSQKRLRCLVNYCWNNCIEDPHSISSHANWCQDNKE